MVLNTVPLVCTTQNCQNKNIKIWTFSGHFHPKMTMVSANWMLHKLLNSKIIYQTLSNCVNCSKTMFSQGGQQGGHVTGWVRTLTNVKLSEYLTNLVPFGIPNEYILYRDDYSFNRRQKEVLFSLFRQKT
jgi:hypothetical protein